MASGASRTLLNGSGYVTARRAATVSSKVTGKVTEVLIEEGVKVQEGQILARLDSSNVKTSLDLAEAQLVSARSALAGVSDAELMQTWTFKKDGQVVFSQPKIGIIRGMVMNHMIHHRAQLGVYLRMQNVPLPAMYGPSADEGAF